MTLYTVCDSNGNSYEGQAYDCKRDANKLLKSLKEHPLYGDKYKAPWHIETVEDPTRH